MSSNRLSLDYCVVSQRLSGWSPLPQWSIIIQIVNLDFPKSLINHGEWSRALWPLTFTNTMWACWGTMIFFGFDFVFLTKRNEEMGGNCRECSLGKDQLPQPPPGSYRHQPLSYPPTGIQLLPSFPIYAQHAHSVYKRKLTPMQDSDHFPNNPCAHHFLNPNGQSSQLVWPAAASTSHVFSIPEFSKWFLRSPWFAGSTSRLYMGWRLSCSECPNLSSVLLLDTSPQKAILLFSLYISNLKCSCAVPDLLWSLS